MSEQSSNAGDFVLPGFHGVLENVTGCRSVDDVKVAAGLDWTVGFTPIRMEVPGLTDIEGISVPLNQGSILLEDYKAPYKVETGESLGCVVGKGYTPVQNDAMLQVGQFLVKEGLAQWSWAGQMKGGCRVAAQLSIPSGNFAIRRFDGSEDEHATNLALWNGHDGRTRMVGVMTDTRLACFNQIPALQRAGKAWSGRHTLSVGSSLENIKASVLKALDAMRFEKEEMQLLADHPFDGKGFAGFLAQLLTGEDEETAAVEIVTKSEGRKRTLFENRAGLLATLYTNGRGNKGHDMYDALQSVIEWVDHYKGDREAEANAETEALARARQNVVASRTNAAIASVSSAMGSAQTSLTSALSARERRVAERRYLSASFGSGSNLKLRARRLLVERAKR